jgi:Chain length determinant protein
MHIDGDMAEIYDFFGALRRRIWLILAMSVACALLMFLLSLVMRPVYRSMATLDPVTSDSNPLTASLVTSSMSALGGSLAALTGGASEADRDTDEAVTVLNSREFTERFIEENNLLPELFPKLWDAKNARWKEGVQVPTLWRGYFFFDRLRKIDTDTNNDFVTVEVAWFDRFKAAEWANKMVMMLNDELRARAVKSADDSLAYLRDELARTNDTATQEAISRLMEGALKRKMLATVTPDFELRFVDRALPSEADRPASPKKLLMISVGAPFGALLGIAISLLLYRRELAASGKL